MTRFLACLGVSFVFVCAFSFTSGCDQVMSCVAFLRVLGHLSLVSFTFCCGGSLIVRVNLTFSKDKGQISFEGAVM